MLVPTTVLIMGRCVDFMILINVLHVLLSLNPNVHRNIQHHKREPTTSIGYRYKQYSSLLMLYKCVHISTTMLKRNKIQSLSVLLLLLASCISARHYFIAPNVSKCQDYNAGNCFTLIEFAMNISHIDQGINLTLSFLPGEHLLTTRLTVNGSQNIALTGQNSSNSSVYTVKCQGTSGFEFGDIRNLNITHLKFIGCGNVYYGGAISIITTNTVLIKGCHFIDNHVTWSGGAIFVKDIVAMKIETSFFNNNSAESVLNDRGTRGGAIGVIQGSVINTNSHFTSNSAELGGSIYVETGNISSTNGSYTNNIAQIKIPGGQAGGAIGVQSGNISSMGVYYTNNSADTGGAIFAYLANIYSNKDHYINNSGHRYGGAIFVSSSGNISSTSNHYIDNSAGEDGGAINIYSGNLSSTTDHYANNSAGSGGAIIMGLGSCNVHNNTFIMNTAAEGAVIHKTGGILEIGQSILTDNFASNKSSLYLDNVTSTIAEGVTFINNQGSLFVSSTQVQIIGAAAFINNLGDFGGAITAIQKSQVTLSTTSTVTIRSNTATNGGGIYLALSTLQVYHPLELTDNRASEYGGGIYTSRSEIEFTSEQTQTLEIINNIAPNGGAICAIESNIHISETYVDFNSNRAITNGGAIYLGQNSKIYLLKNEPDRGNLNVRLDFTNNSAEKGSAIYVADNTNDGALCHRANTEINQAECFIQTLMSYTSN